MGSARKKANYSVKANGTAPLELQALYQIAQLTGSALDLKKALSETLRILHDILRMERATLVLPDESGRKLIIMASYGLTKEEEERGVYGFNEGVIGKVFQTAYPFVVPDVRQEPLFLNRTGARAGFSKGEISFIGVPITLLDKTVGVLTVDRLFGVEVSFEEDIRFLTVVATLMAQFLDLHNAIKRKEEDLREENRTLKEELSKKYNRHNIIGQSKAMQSVFRVVDKVGASRATVLLLGESGTGKELVSRAIHQVSPRKGAPFIKLNCAALPENLLESELFGHEKGAFTGAVALKKGRFELADSGTLFLDEIGELPLPLQAKILRVLQEQQFERLGGTQTLSVDVRVIAATNRNLDSLVREGLFRADLYYRLNVVPVVLPPLRERREDLPLLIDYFLRDSNKSNGRNVIFSKDSLEFFSMYGWPGNVRELQNIIERLVIMADDDKVRKADLPSYMLAEPEPAPIISASVEPKNVHDIPAAFGAPVKSLYEMERKEVEAALQRHGWIQARAARELGLTPRQIGYKMKKYGLRSPHRINPES